MSLKKYEEAVKFAAESPKGLCLKFFPISQHFNFLIKIRIRNWILIYSGVLRTTETIRRLQQIPFSKGQIFLDLLYFKELLEKGRLDKEESIILCQRVLNLDPEKARKHIRRWIQVNRIEYSEVCFNLKEVIRLIKFLGTWRYFDQVWCCTCSTYLRAQVTTRRFYVIFRWVSIHRKRFQIMHWQSDMNPIIQT